MCSGSSSRFAADLLVWESGGSRYMVGVLCEERVDHKRMQGTAEKARDGAPKAG
jgi:hypothetical protein